MQIDPLAMLVGLTASLLVAISLQAAGAAERQAAYSLTPGEHGMVLKTPDGRTVLQYMTKKPENTNLTANSVCCLYPVYTPTGVRAVDFAPGDHRHHRGVFLAWHAAKCGAAGADFWGWGSWAPTENRVIRSRSIALSAGDASRAAIEVVNDWTIEETTAIEEQTAIAVREEPCGFVIDEDFRLAAKVDVQLLQTAFGGFCVKGRKDGEAEYFAPGGKVDLPEPHHLKPETDWPARPWYDYVIRLESGETLGVAVIDHPSNPPSTWHNLKPIAMVNPCIVTAGPLDVKQGETLRLRYRLVVHDGPAPIEQLDKLAAEFAGSTAR